MLAKLMIRIVKYVSAASCVILLSTFASTAHAAVVTPQSDVSLINHEAMGSAETSSQEINIKYFVQSEITASEAKAIAGKEYPDAEVVDISRSGAQYKVRLIRKDGRVIDLFIDVATGSVVK